MPSKCIVLDIETIPDTTVVLDTKGYEFPLPIFHKVVSLAYAVLGNNFELQDLKVLGLNEHTEAQALADFGKEITDDTLLVTWSGRRFDLPIILYRSMKHGIPCPWYWKREFDKRFSLTGHVDLQDHMMLFGATDKIKLDHAACLVGLPGKGDIQGSDVQELWARNRFLDIGAYNVSDVVTLAVLFIRWAHLRGLASKEEVNAALDSVLAYPMSGYPSGTPPTILAISEGLNMVSKKCDWKSLKVH